MNVHKATGFIIVTCIFVVFVTGVTDRFVFKLNSDIREMEEHLRVFNFIDMLKVTPDVFSFKYAGSLSKAKIKHVLSEVKRVYGNKIIEIEQAKEFIKWIPMDSTDVMSVSAGHESGLNAQLRTQESESYFGMNVEAAWLHGYNGTGIYVAVTDVGINADITDLRKTLDVKKAFNFINKTTNVTPEYFHNYRTDSLRYVDHGNRVTSIIGAEKGNGLCSAGIANGAKVVSLRIFSVTHEYHLFKLNTTSDVMAAGLAYRLEDIHIYSNIWSPSKSLEPLDMVTREAILHGATKGRHNLGAIYVVPDGSDGVSGSGLANSLYTIAVNSVGVNGTLPTKPQVSACVLTSGLGEGSKLHTNYMLTSSSNNTCSRSFKGVSAAVAEVSAIIALVLQARQDLTVRDIQHLLVESSDRRRLTVAHSFQRNGAGKFFNPFLGFGLIDAEKMVTFSKTWHLVKTVYNNTLRYAGKISMRLRKPTFPHTVLMMSIIEFNIEEDRCNPHVNTIEHVVLRIKHEVISQTDARLEIVSPCDTASVVVDNTVVTNLNEETSLRELTSVHFWGESPFGLWKVKIQLGHEMAADLVASTSLIVYGTFNETKQKQKCARPSDEPDLSINTKQSKTIQTNRYTSKSTESTGNKYKKQSTKGGATTQSISHNTCIHPVVFVALLFYFSFI
ncbi:proprotein convertase subtilisin/kexin type 6-like isoform X2 [Mercenaria mercenaria]|uniref:proprotein convertase subtilisin/kexin type 6-like isoform X2 n=1 Tax=Mercenaria mercenaria TaxID=6596 RepID=UPI00234E9765|nr:proprotein convertase subtilisin/kexin type 6-like isoform X2 [Mercenaria mercenaria]